MARWGKGTSSLRVGLLAERLPALTVTLRDLLAAEGQDLMEVFEVTTDRLAMMVGIVPDTQEGIVLFADRAQPSSLGRRWPAR